MDRPVTASETGGQPPVRPAWWRKAWRYVRRLQEDMSNDNLTLVAAGVAFYWMLALFPAIIAMVTVYALFADANQASEQLSPILSALPQEARVLIETQLTKTVEAGDGGLTFGLLASLLAGDGLNLRPSGVIGSVVGAIVLMLIDRFLAGRGGKK